MLLLNAVKIQRLKMMISVDMVSFRIQVIPDHQRQECPRKADT